MEDDVKFTGVEVLPKFLYVAPKDEAMARATSTDMEIMVDWRIRPGCWRASTIRREAPPKP